MDLDAWHTGRQYRLHGQWCRTGNGYDGHREVARRGAGKLSRCRWRYQGTCHETFKIILSDDNVKAVLINIFGGIVRCDLIAEGVIGAVAEVGVTVPVVVQLEGTSWGKVLADSGLNITAASSLQMPLSR